MYPLIIVGMHRSGTSLVSRKLRDAGVFMGANLSGGHSESQCFLAINKRIFALAHASWDNPQPVDWMMRDAALLDGVIDTLRSEFDLDQFHDHFFGEHSVGQSAGDAAVAGQPGHDPRNAQSTSWGWKDPRTSYTLPLWLRLFPRAKVVHVVRHGVDVAASLVTREQRRKFRFDSPARSVRCLDYDRAFELWEQYVQQCQRSCATLDSHQQLTLTYEDLLTIPGASLHRLLEFANTPEDVTTRLSTVDELAQDIDASRHMAHRNNAELNEMATQKLRTSAMLRHYYGAASAASIAA